MRSEERLARLTSRAHIARAVIAFCFYQSILFCCVVAAVVFMIVAAIVDKEKTESGFSNYTHRSINNTTLNIEVVPAVDHVKVRGNFMLYSRAITSPWQKVWRIICWRNALRRWELDRRTAVVWREPVAGRVEPRVEPFKASLLFGLAESIIERPVQVGSRAVANILVRDAIYDRGSIGWRLQADEQRVDPSALADDESVFSALCLLLERSIGPSHFLDLLNYSPTGPGQGYESKSKNKNINLISKTLATIFSFLLFSIGASLIIYGVDQSREIGGQAAWHTLLAWGVWLVATIVLLEASGVTL
jgi:hypothetical protein